MRLVNGDKCLSRSATARELMCRRNHSDGTALRVRLARKARKNRQRILRLKEYHRLRAMVPSIAAKPKVSKVTVIEEAIRYIGHLHGALIWRLQSRGLPPCLQGLPFDMNSLNHTNIRQVVRILMENKNSAWKFLQSVPESQTPSAPASSLATLRDDSSSHRHRFASEECERSRSLPSYMLRLPHHRRPS
ncbi:uncharacterized protein LOC135390926 [Ornithodoros turicata]|uniref:uncharacterized protein LOC135390926 n=1 Tax=Ornithodoros turicata TaxID=34597 RepID=UPI0031387880